MASRYQKALLMGLLLGRIEVEYDRALTLNRAAQRARHIEIAKRNVASLRALIEEDKDEPQA